MKVAMGAERFGYPLKEILAKHLVGQGHEIIDFGMYDLENKLSYIYVSDEVSKAVASGAAERGIVLCSSGMGVAIVANKHKGVHCALVESVDTARMSREINDANVLALGGSVVDAALATQMVDAFMTTEFASAGDAARAALLRSLINEVKAMEDGNFK
ncbi:MAG: RpiB/LacA/LacB family sugar-phosphate isomerase [Christensenellaceae bacterium]|jgi:ribose 5-phosphate isomerase B|nr:RpiB/LacA/LacB family sugar-phosphate isomerase [Christensenellaceae bacterium]